MKIHSDILSAQDINNAARIARASAYEISTAGSRSRSGAFEVTLSGVSKSMTARYRDVRAATFRQWGFFLAELYRIDPEMIAGPYKSDVHFHNQTQGAFESGTYDVSTDERSARQYR